MAIKPVHIHGKFRRSKAIGTFVPRTFTVSPRPDETIREAWYREHGSQWEIYIIQSSDPTIPLDSVLPRPE